jgi:hypothetical protein
LEGTLAGENGKLSLVFPPNTPLRGHAAIDSLDDEVSRLGFDPKKAPNINGVKPFADSLFEFI